MVRSAGNLTNDLGQTFTYDATGQQATASYGGYTLQQSYDGDTLRGKKTENGTDTYYLRSSVLGWQVVAEIKSTGGAWSWSRGYVYDGGGRLLAIQSDSQVRWAMQDPVTKSQRVTDSIGGVSAAVDLDPWGGETGRSWNAGTQPRKYTTYERDGNGSDEAMMRRYNRWHSRFDQPDPADGSYNFSNPQSFNRYSYTHADPVNFVDPAGLDLIDIGSFDFSTVYGSLFGPFGAGGGTLRANPDPEIAVNVGTEAGDATGLGGGPAHNPNCIMNAVSGAAGLARPFGNVNTNPNSPAYLSIGHDGVHVLAAPGSKVTTLPTLTGRVIDVHYGGDGTRIVDVLLDSGNVAIYKDLEKVKVKAGQRLKAGSVIGTVGEGGDYGGLHFALLRGGMKEHNAYRAITSGRSKNLITVNMFINPLGPESPVACPGVSVDNAGVTPYP